MVINMWLIYALCSAGFAGITSILAKVGIRDTDSNLATAIRTVVILLFSWLMVFLVGSQDTISQISAKTFTFLVLSGIATGCSWLCYFAALRYGEVHKVMAIDKASIILTLLLAFLILGEALTSLKIVSMAVIVGGTYMMMERKNAKKGNIKEREVTPEKKRGGMKWLTYAILSAIFASFTAILGKIGIDGVESNLGTAIRTVVVLIMAWLVVFAGKKQNGLKRIDKKSWVFICLSGITTGLSWLCYYKALQKGEAGIVVLVDRLSIVVTVGLSCMILKEKLTKKSAAGLAIITAGILLLLIK